VTHLPRKYYQRTWVPRIPPSQLALPAGGNLSPTVFAETAGPDAWLGADADDRIMHRVGAVAVAARVLMHGRPFPCHALTDPLVGGGATLTDGCITIQKQIFVKCFHSFLPRQGRRDLFQAPQAMVLASGRATGSVVPCRGPCQCGRGSMVLSLARRATSPGGTVCAAYNMMREGQGGKYA
jgi:hypothetical protein